MVKYKNATLTSFVNFSMGLESYTRRRFSNTLKENPLESDFTTHTAEAFQLRIKFIFLPSSKHFPQLLSNVATQKKIYY